MADLKRVNRPSSDTALRQDIQATTLGVLAKMQACREDGGKQVMHPAFMLLEDFLLRLGMAMEGPSSPR